MAVKRWLQTSVVSLISISSLTVLKGGPPDHVPFRLHEHLIVISGSVGELENLNIVIDTGTSSTVIDDGLAKRLGLTGAPKQVFAFGKELRVREVVLPEVVLGSSRFEAIPAWAASLEFPRMAKMIRIDALIGLDFLKRTNVAIDYESKTIAFGPIIHSENSIAIYGSLPFLVVPVHIEDQVFHFMLDTGASGLIFFQTGVDGRLVLRPTGEVLAIECAGGREYLKKVSLAELMIGTSRWADPFAYVLRGRTALAGIDGVLGIHALGLKRLCLDFQRNLMSWEA